MRVFDAIFYLLGKEAKIYPAYLTLCPRTQKQIKHPNDGRGSIYL